MSRVIQGQDNRLHTASDISEYLIEQINQNSQKSVGTEVEFFLLSSTTNAPITVKDGQKAFLGFHDGFQSRGYRTKLHAERHDGYDYITSVSIDDIGSVDLETGHGFEFASAVCRDSDHILKTERIFFDVLSEVESAIGYKSVFKGFLQEYAQPVEIKRQRSHFLRASYFKRFGAAARQIFKAQGSTASTQVNVDTCQENFHEVFKILLLAEPALALHHADGTNRAHMRKQAYAPLVPEQVNPLVDVWECKDNREAVACIVNRLLDIQVPFLPDAAGNYRELPLDPVTRRPPTVRELLESRGLSEMELKNILPLFQTHPALRRPAVLEVRGVDSLGTPEEISALADRVTRICYDDNVRRQLLQDFRHFTCDDIRALHEVATWKDKEAAMQQIIGGMRVKDIVHTIIEISRAPVAPTPARHTHTGRRLGTTPSARPDMLTIMMRGYKTRASL